MFHIRNGTFTGVLASVVAENEKTAMIRSRRYKKDELKRKNKGTVCRVTHIDGIKQQPLIYPSDNHRVIGSKTLSSCRLYLPVPHIFLKSAGPEVSELL